MLSSSSASVARCLSGCVWPTACTCPTSSASTLSTTPTSPLSDSDFHAASHSAYSSFSAQQQSLRQHHSVAVMELQLLVGAVESEEAERVNEGKQSFETEREEIRNKNLESINELRITLEARIEELERTFDELHRYYR